jgi:hypothetical protein
VRGAGVAGPLGGVGRSLVNYVILFLIYIRDICSARLDTFTFYYIDDICIGPSATSRPKLKHILKRTAKAILREAKQSAIEFDIRKQGSFTLAARKSLL